jgi:hypothetical protein
MEIPQDVAKVTKKVFLNPSTLFGLIVGGMAMGVWGEMQKPTEEYFGAGVPPQAVCGLRGTILLPTLPTEQDYMTVILDDQHIQVNGLKTNPYLSGPFNLDSDGFFLLGNADGGEKPKIYVNFKNGEINYSVKCVKQPTPTLKPPAKPTPHSFNLDNSHNRSIAYQRGFHPNLTKPAGKERIIAGRIFPPRG